GAVAREIVVRAGGDAHIGAGAVTIEWSQPPTGRDMPQCIVRELRRLEHGRQVDELTLVREAVAAAVITIARERIRYGRVRAGVPGLVTLERTNTMRPRVVRIDRHAFGRALPHLKKHAVVGGAAAALNLNEIGYILAGILEIDQLQ